MQDKGRIVLQWHITNKCNKNCKHCYQGNIINTNEILFSDINNVVEQYKELIIVFNKKYNKNFYKGHINLTGGEPFIRKDIWKILEIFHYNKNFFSFAILTNGYSLDNSKNRLKLKTYEPSFIQLSIEGYNKTHDNIRGEGDFERNTLLIKSLKKDQFKVYISFTAFKDNYKEFPLIAKWARKLKVDKLWSDRIVPIGNANNLIESQLSPEECIEYFKIMNKERTKKTLFRRKNFIEMNRSLQFLVTDEKPHNCSAADTLITIMPDGSVLPCRRLPIVVGNIFKNNLSEIYFSSDIMKLLRTEKIPETCIKCSYHIFCQGGAKCIAYANYGKIMPDPGCIINKLFKNENH